MIVSFQVMNFNLFLDKKAVLVPGDVVKTASIPQSVTLSMLWEAIIIMHNNISIKSLCRMTEAASTPSVYVPPLPLSAH